MRCGLSRPWPGGAPRGRGVFSAQGPAELGPGFTFTGHNGALFSESQWGAWRETATPSWGFPLKLFQGLRRKTGTGRSLGAGGGRTKGIQMIFIVAGLHPLPRRHRRLLGRRASEWQLGPLPSPSLSLQPCPGFLWAQPEDLRLTLQTVQASLPKAHFGTFQMYVHRETVYSNYTKYHPLLYL